MHINAPARQTQARCGLQGNTRHNRLTGRNTTQHTTGVVGKEPLRGYLIPMRGALLRDAVKAGTNLHTLHRIDAHQGMGQVRIQAIKDRLTQAGRHALGDHVNPGADGIAFLAEGVHVGLHLGDLVRIRAEKRVLVHLIPVQFLGPDRPQLRQVTANTDTQSLLEILARHRTGGHPHRGFPG